MSWKTYRPRSCDSCKATFSPSGPRQELCPACNPNVTQCRTCGGEVWTHRRHVCKEGMSA